MVMIICESKFNWIEMESETLKIVDFVGGSSNTINYDRQISGLFTDDELNISNIQFFDDASYNVDNFINELFDKEFSNLNNTSLSPGDINDHSTNNIEDDGVDAATSANVNTSLTSNVIVRWELKCKLVTTEFCSSKLVINFFYDNSCSGSSSSKNKLTKSMAAELVPTTQQSYFLNIHNDIVEFSEGQRNRIKKT